MLVAVSSRKKPLAVPPSTNVTFCRFHRNTSAFAKCTPPRNAAITTETIMVLADAAATVALTRLLRDGLMRPPTTTADYAAEAASDCLVPRCQDSNWPGVAAKGPSSPWRLLTGRTLAQHTGKRE